MHTIIGIVLVSWLGWIIWDTARFVVYHCTPKEWRNDDEE